MHPRSLFSLTEHLDRLSKDGDPLEALAGTVEFERFRPLLTKGLGYSDGAKGGLRWCRFSGQDAKLIPT